VLESWENRLNGWAAANWQTDPGSVAVTTNGVTDGANALEITALGSGAWFGSVAFTPLLDLSTMGCAQSTLTGVHDMFLFFNAGTFNIDQLTVKQCALRWGRPASEPRCLDEILVVNRSGAEHLGLGR